MRVCIPTEGNMGLEEKVGKHFIGVPTFTIVDVETNYVEVVPNTTHNTGGISYPPDLMNERKVDAVICSHLGEKTIDLFEKCGICVYVGAYGRVKDALRMWKGDMLHLATNRENCKKKH